MSGKSITDAQELFVQELLAGKTQRNAYKSAFSPKNTSDKTIDEKASRLFANSKVRARFDELKGKVKKRAEEKGILSALDVLNELSNIGFGKKEYPTHDAFGNEYKRKSTIHERIKALELCGKHLGMFTDRVEVCESENKWFKDDKEA